MMPSWLIQLRDVVWSAVIAVVLVVLAVVIALFTAISPVVPITLVLGGVVFALLAQRSA
jgi:hypothetical protein